MKWLDQFCFGAVFIFGVICGLLLGVTYGAAAAIDLMEKEAVFRQAGFYGKDGDTLKFYWGPKWIKETK